MVLEMVFYSGQGRKMSSITVTAHKSNPTAEKVCPGCEKPKPATRDYFGYFSDTHDKLGRYCKGCQKLYRQGLKPPAIAQRKMARSEKKNSQAKTFLRLAEGERRCIVCGCSKDATTEHYTRVKSPEGISRACKSCQQSSSPPGTPYKCRQCGKEKPRDTDHFYTYGIKGEEGRPKLRTTCKDCDRGQKAKRDDQYYPARHLRKQLRALKHEEKQRKKEQQEKLATIKEELAARGLVLCNKCGKIKSANKNRNKPLGLQDRCKTCQKEENDAWLAKSGYKPKARKNK